MISITHIEMSNIWQWFGDAAKKAALGRLKVVMSSDGFQVRVSHVTRE